MVFFNYATLQMAAKIVYYGPGLCGKTTNLQYIYQKTSPKSRGEMVSLETETDRTLFFDLLPLDVGNIAGFKTRFQLYTVPGQVFYNNTRKLVLRGVDGIVFVADSQAPMFEANVESFKNLDENIKELGLKLEDIPMVIQYNKRDLKNIAPVEEMNRVLNERNIPWFEASALIGNGVFETLKGISKTTLITLRKKALGEDKPRIPDIATRAMDRPITPPPVIFGNRQPTPNPPIEQQKAQAIEQPVETPEQGMPISEEEVGIPTEGEIARETVEFAQVAIPVSQPAAVKKISVRSSDVAYQLDALRELYTGKAGAYATKEIKKTKDTTTEVLNGLLEAAKNKERVITKRLKIRLDPSEIEAVKTLSLDFHLNSETVHKKFSNALSVNVEGKTNPKKITLEIKIEILKK